MPTATEQEKAPPLVGTKANPAREPSKRPATGKGGIGDTAFMDSIIIVVAAWLVLLFLMYSLRNHNV